MSLYQLLIALGCIAAALSLIMSLAWLVWRRTGNSGWVDTIWTFGLGGIGCAGVAAAATASGGLTLHRATVLTLIALWSLRLGLHIAQRSAGISDDPRYAKLVGDWGEDASRQMFWLLQKQALVSVPLALSMLLAAWNPVTGLRLQDILAAIVFAVAILGEGLADAQLKRFREDPANRGRVCDTGLWAWSRHPNYFFEWLGWWAYPLFAIGEAAPFGWFALLGPTCMYWLLVHVSGIPPLEAHMTESRGKRFQAYQRRTSAFFPMPPRSAEAAP